MADQQSSRQAETPDEDKSRADEVGEQLSAQAASKLHARDDGSLEVWSSLGGWRGLAEATLPPTAFLLVFLFTEELGPALLSSLLVAGAFGIARLIQRGTLVQSVSGIVGVGLCALVAQQTGEARDFYVLGILVNVVYTTAFVISIAVRWPVVGLLFGFIRGQGSRGAIRPISGVATHWPPGSWWPSWSRASQFRFRSTWPMPSARWGPRVW
ncbi:DUF3159 domain-containing protein [Nesterenkonia pannonica]|uniref:DUF3159 domain-containing protein n=1 Tax=Nesterenkonia pannonica TaxID=1548602 RepID=UPI0021644A0E|nr:DUF3159 domain-containing protein [Nesterenkonia pannonica]